MMTIRALIRISLLEFLRDRVVWVGLFVSVVLFGLSILLGSLSFNEQQRILAHIGWSAIQLSTMGMGLILSANWLHKEMDRQTCLIVLARPVTRDQFMLGKYFAILMLATILQIILSFLLYLLLGFTYSFQNFGTVFLGTLLEVLTVISICFSMATFMRPMLAFIAGFAMFLIGHWSQEIEFFGNKVKDPIYIVVSKVAQWIVPNLFQFNWRSVYFLEGGVTNTQVSWVMLHSIAWIIFSVSLGILVFRKKDLV